MRRRVHPLCTSESIFLYDENVTYGASPPSDAYSLYMKMKVSLVSIAGAESLSMERRMCLSSLWRHPPTSALRGRYTLLLYRSVVSYLQARCRRRSLMCFSWICAAPCSCDIQLDLMATSPVFHYPSAPFSRLWTSVLACCEYPCVLLSTLVSYKNQHDCVACTICVFFVYVSAMQNASSARCSPFVNCRHLCENRIRSKSQSSVVIIIFKK